MKGIYNSRQIYNKLKKKQYEEYIKRKNKYYLDKKRCYEKYVKMKKKYYMYKRKYYMYKKRYDEEYYNRNNYILENKKKCKQIDTSQSKFIDYLKTDDIKKNNSSLNFEDLYNEESYNEESYNEELYNEVLYNGELYIGESYNEVLYNEEFLEENYEKSLKNNIEDKKDEWIEDYELKDKNINSNSLKELYNKKLLEEKYGKDLVGKDEKLLVEYNNIVEKKDLSQKSEASTCGLYGKFPVILAEANIIIPVEGTISLDEEVMEIKRARKNVFLTQAHVIPFSSRDMDQNSGILFIEGFIKNNIEYEAKNNTTVGKNNLCGNIKYCTVEVPFNFTTKINFLILPIFNENINTIELEVFKGKSPVGDIYKESVIGCNPYEESFVFTEVFNEKPFVELVKATFIQIDVNKNLTHETHSKQKSTKITEKIILNLTLKVLQKQQVRVVVE